VAVRGFCADCADAQTSNRSAVKTRKSMLYSLLAYAQLR
jgi:hypothetical protein